MILKAVCDIYVLALDKTGLLQSLVECAQTARDAELRNAGCVNTFKEKVSGAKTDRPELAKLIRRLEPDDTLVVTRLDRLTRSTRDLLNILAAVAERGAGFKSLKDAWVRHHDPPRAADANDLGRLGRVRARANPRPDGRGPQATLRRAAFGSAAPAR